MFGGHFKVILVSFGEHYVGQFADLYFPGQVRGQRIHVSASFCVIISNLLVEKFVVIYRACFFQYFLFRLWLESKGD